MYQRNNNGSKTTEYVDLDHNSDLDKCRSLVGYMFMLVSGAISWKASLHNHVALSSTETEYMTLTFIANEAIWLRGLLLDFGLEQKSVDI